MATPVVGATIHSNAIACLPESPSSALFVRWGPDRQPMTWVEDDLMQLVSVTQLTAQRKKTLDDTGAKRKKKGVTLYNSTRLDHPRQKPNT